MEDEQEKILKDKSKNQFETIQDKNISSNKNVRLQLPQFDYFLCGKALNNCMQEFQTGNLNSNPDLVKINKDSIFICKDHPKKKLKYICKTDNKLFCSQCVFKHLGHADSVFEFGEDKIFEQLLQMKKDLGKIKKIIDSTFNKLASILNQEYKIDSEFLWQTAEQAKNIIQNQQCQDSKILLQFQIQEQQLKGQLSQIIEQKDQLKQSNQIMMNENKQLQQQILLQQNKIQSNVQTILDLQSNNSILQSKLQLQNTQIAKQEFKIHKDFDSNSAQYLIEQIQKLIPFQNEVELLYKGSRDGFKSKVFHSKCDNQGQTLCILRTQTNKIFGGYTSIPWQSPQVGINQKGQGLSFLFSLRDDGEIVKLPCVRKSKEIFHRSDAIIWFGIADLSLTDDCNLQSNRGYSNIGNSYQAPQGINYDSDQAKSYLAGASNFIIQEIEVFKVSPILNNSIK